MISKPSLKFFITLICTALCISIFAVAHANDQAEQKATAQAIDSAQEKTVKVRKKTMVATVAPARDTKLARLKADIEQCGSACNPGGSGMIAAGGDQTLDHECDDNGNCHCFGAIDCVAMSKICAPDTIGCNDQGCLCKEGEGDGG